MLTNNCRGRFLSCKHAQPRSDEPEVVEASKEFHMAWLKYILTGYFHFGGDLYEVLSKH